MPFPATGNLAPALAELSRYAKEVDDIKRRANALLCDIGTGLVGQRVRRFDGRIWEICQVDWRYGSVHCYGVSVSKRGKVGTRAFDLGKLEDCKFLTTTERDD
jgi:hypothetical protein